MRLANDTSSSGSGWRDGLGVSFLFWLLLLLFLLLHDDGIHLQITRRGVWISLYRPDPQILVHDDGVVCNDKSASKPVNDVVSYSMISTFFFVVTTALFNSTVSCWNSTRWYHNRKKNGEEEQQLYQKKPHRNRSMRQECHGFYINSSFGVALFLWLP